MNSLHNVTVLGSGVLGSQIVMQAAYAGKNVVAYDIKQEFLDKLPERYGWMRANYRKDLPDYSDEKFDAAIARIRTSTDLADAVKDADLVIEAIPEQLDLKKSVWKNVGELAPEKTIFATNTSSLRPSDFVGASGRPNRMTTLHFANRVWLKNTGEVMRHDGLDDDVFQAVLQFAKEINLLPVPVEVEQPGYVLNTVLIPWLQAGQALVGRGVADPKDVDLVWRVGTNSVTGPLAGADIAGLNTVYNISSQADDPDVRAFAQFLKENYVDKGKLGVSTGEGIYRYDADGNRIDEDGSDAAANLPASGLENVTVLGSGVLGSQIVMQAAYAGKNVVAYDIKQEFLDKLPERYDWMRAGYRKDVADFTDEKFDAAIGRIRTSTDLADALKDADLVIEAVPEKLELKKSVWKDVGEKAPEKTIFATNSSSLRPSDFAADTGRPNRFLALHFANLVWQRNTGEVMRHEGTGDDAFDKVLAFAKEINLLPIPIRKEQPGYILNSLSIPWLEAAQYLVGKGVADPKTIDKVWTTGTDMTAGPFKGMDMVGLNTVYNITQQSDNEYIRAFADIVKRDYIDAGKLGLAVREGFYKYDAEGNMLDA